MIGLILVTHYDFGYKLLDVVETILEKKLDNVEVVSITTYEALDKIREKIERAFEKVRHEDGLIIVTDLFGGTTTNVSLRFVNGDDIIVLTGVNIPMLLAYERLMHEETDPIKLAEIMVQKAKEAIVASHELIPYLDRTSGSQE